MCVYNTPHHQPPKQSHTQAQAWRDGLAFTQYCHHK